ncbi:hypothetical protein BDV10DRAFT_167293 [Aspergillus recurvatus]
MHLKPMDHVPALSNSILHSQIVPFASYNPPFAANCSLLYVFILWLTDIVQNYR